MNTIYSEKSATFLERGLIMPTRSGCLLKNLLLRLRTDRTGRWLCLLPVCIALAVYLALVCPSCLYASGQLNGLDYETALQKGKDAQRPLLVFFTTPWCYQCTEMKRKVFQNKDIISILNERFFLVEVDISKNTKLKEDFRIYYTPTTVFLDIHGKPIMEEKGYIPTKRFRKLLRYVSNGYYKTIAFSDFEKK